MSEGVSVCFVGVFFSVCFVGVFFAISIKIDLTLVKLQAFENITACTCSLETSESFAV